MSKTFICYSNSEFHSSYKAIIRQLPEIRNTWCYTVILEKLLAIRYWLGCIAMVKQDNQFAVNYIYIYIQLQENRLHSVVDKFVS